MRRARSGWGVIAAIIIVILVIAGAAAYYHKSGGQARTTAQTGQTRTASQAKTGSLTIRAATLQGGISTLDIMQAAHLLDSKGYNLKVLRLQKTPDIIAALAKGDTDFAVIPAEMAAKMIENGANIKIVAVDMLQNQAVLVRGDSNIRNVTDLNGKLVGAVVASGTYKIFKAYMKIAYNMTVVEENTRKPGVISVVNVPPGSILDALNQGQVDAIVIWEPFVSLGLAHGDRILASYPEMWNKTGLTGEPVMLVWVVRGDFAAKHPDAVNAFIQARDEAAKIWVNNKTYTFQVLGSLYKLDSKVLNILYNRTVIVTGNLNSGLIKSIRSEWWLAWKGGYLPRNPQTIPDTVFYKG
ncbi:MAG: ABC transporter substrate-binding protein [Desulfurococcales archaeon]|nr:ABC transporter substrate-binding protein [Desulfurococcales archaeon]